MYIYTYWYKYLFIRIYILQLDYYCYCMYRCHHILDCVSSTHGMCAQVVCILCRSDCTCTLEVSMGTLSLRRSVQV